MAGRRHNPPDSARQRLLLRELLPHLRVVRGPDARGEHECWCPFHDDGNGKPPHHPNLSVSERGFICHACGAKGGLRQLAERLGVSVDGGSPDLEATYDYRDEAGKLLYQVCRRAGRRFSERRPNGIGGWEWNLNGVDRVLYRLPELQKASPDADVYIVEGEKDADRLTREGFIATTNSGGAGKWKKEYAEALRDRNVVILPDNDESGRKHTQQVARSLHGVARSIKVIEFPELPEKGDVSDWLAAGHTVEELQAIAASTPELQQNTEARSSRKRPGVDDTEKQGSQGDRLVALVIADGIELFHNDLGDGFARVPVRGHVETWRCRGRDFRKWLAGRFWHSEEKALSSDALGAALNVIEAIAQFEGQEHRLHNRVAFHDGAIWCDMADTDWRAVKVTRSGWDIVEPPTLFRRYPHQQPFPEPAPGGDLHDLLRFVNLRDPSQGLLLLVYVVCCFVPEIPHPIPVLHGPQGAAKTTLFGMIRRLVDPSAVEVLSLPRNATEMVQQLSHHWAPYYDNISTLPDWVSDVLCRAVTGEGFSKRELYTDDDDVIYRFRRCVGLNGVNVAAQKPDLLDRCNLFGLEPISLNRRRSEKEIWEEFEAERPGLLGSIFDTLSRAMALRDSIRLSSLPRMADFALWGCAVAEALGHSAAEFMSAYQANTEARNEEALQGSPVAAMIMELMELEAIWEGTPTDLLSDLEKRVEEHRVNTKDRGWPKAAHALSRRLNEVRPNLSAVGIEVSTRRDGRRRLVTIQKVPTNTVTCDTCDTGTGKPLDDAIPCDDATVDGSKGASPNATPDQGSFSGLGADNDACDAGDASAGSHLQTPSSTTYREDTGGGCLSPEDLEEP